MVLTIKAISYKGEPLVSPLTAVFEKHGGTLGRSSDNHLVLADEEKVVSGEHGVIKYENESYYYIDMSLNGTQVTNRNQLLHHEKILIKDQDALQIGDFDLVLCLSSKASEAPTDRHDCRQDALSISMFALCSDIGERLKAKLDFVLCVYFFRVWHVNLYVVFFCVSQHCLSS